MTELSAVTHQQTRMTHDSFCWCKSFICVMCHMCHIYMWCVTFTCVMCHMCDVSHIYMCDVSHWYVWCVTYVTHLYVTHQQTRMTHDSFCWCVTFVCVMCHMCHIYMCDVSHLYVWCVTYVTHLYVTHQQTEWLMTHSADVSHESFVSADV